ncbi:DUF6366 family protein [Alkalihalophilus marmarensis]|jgi:hypothetical protein|uniref:Phage capsid protein n=1 Tax=Alkalihalophilus marmarensis DSM 21297 TaxID=1188261 RepID=U6SI73_9BACI|nr:DUF6366 family protein [Alkalihalophilus marmarensis]ERN51404.1 phage capsid protein [Alkalihalophilus marmarensis DSM 21297]MCM3490383.1 DUF6366 family protein [Alkalihalophilus marmarensis]
MSENKESPERRRERLRQEELKRNRTNSMSDGFNRASSGSMVDLVNSLGWKGTGILIIVIILLFITGSFVFSR